MVSHEYRRSRPGISMGSAGVRKRRPNDGLQADGGGTDRCLHLVSAGDKYGQVPPAAEP
jgi:hypothetical protein